MLAYDEEINLAVVKTASMASMEVIIVGILMD